MRALMLLLLLVPFATAFNCTGYCGLACADVARTAVLPASFVAGTCMPFCVKECDALLNNVATTAQAAAVAVPQFTSTTYVMSMCGRAPAFTQTGAPVTVEAMQAAYVTLGAMLDTVLYGRLAFPPAANPIVQVNVVTPCVAGVPTTCAWTTAASSSDSCPTGTFIIGSSSDHHHHRLASRPRNRRSWAESQFAALRAVHGRR